MRPGLALCGANVVAIDSSGGIGNTIISARFTVQVNTLCLYSAGAFEEIP